MMNSIRSLFVSLVAAGGLGLALSAQADDVERRWDVDERAWEDRNVAQKAGSTVRDGLVTVIDSPIQGAFATAALILPQTGGLIARKLLTFAGDIVGLVDNNPVTQHVFKGVVSRQFLRFGAGAHGVRGALGVIHDTEFPKTDLTLEDYIGPQYFHTKAYTHTSVLVTTPAVIISDVLIRPLGGLATFVGARGLGQQLDDYGIQLIKRSLNVEFL